MTVKNLVKFSLLNFLIFFTLPSFAFPFIIVPKAGTTLPNSVGAGASVNAYYTVTNNTLSRRVNNTVEYLPPNVTQVETGGTYPDTCAHSFTLAAFGHAGDSCTLQLKISGPVDASDPDQTHHLFVCFPGMQVYAGTNQSLNVVEYSLEITPSVASLIDTQTLQYTATLRGSDGSTGDVTGQASWTSSNPNAATISATGLARAIHGALQTNIQAGYLNTLSNIAVLNTIKKVASIAITPTNPQLRVGFSTQLTAVPTYDDATSMPPLSSVTWNSATPSVATITSTGLVTGVTAGTSSITAASQGVTSAADVATVVRFAYVAAGTSLQYCLVNRTDGTLTTCLPVAQPFGSGVAVNLAGTFLSGYTSSGTGGSITCPINLDGSVTASSCFNTASLPVNTTGGLSMAINPNTNTVYIPGPANSLFYCATGTDGSITVCTPTSPAPVTPNYPAITPNAQLLYTSAGSNGNINMCNLASDGSVVTCTNLPNIITTPGATINGLAVDPAGIALYISYSTTATACNVVSCTIGQTGVPVCGSTHAVTCNGPINLAVDLSGTRLYFSDTGVGNHLQICALNKGVIGTCAPNTQTFVINQMTIR